MREILFRGKSKDNGEWVYGNLKKCEFHSMPNKYYEYYISLFDGHSIDIGGWNDGEQLFEVIPETVCQYIGLTDKSGTKIFEGDIVQSAEFCPDEGYGVVYWKDEEAMFTVDTDGAYYDFSNLDWTKLEVIGNVIDNPELIRDVEE